MTDGLQSPEDRPRGFTEYFVIVATAYFLAGKFGLSLASLNPSASAVWAPTGIALAAFLLRGNSAWPGVFVGAFLVNVTTAGTAITSLTIASGNTLEGLAGAYLVTRFANGNKVFDRSQDVFKFVLLEAAACSISATVGVVSLRLGGLTGAAEYGAVWTTWWLGDTVGALVATPPIVLWAREHSLRLDRRHVLEGLVLLLYLFVVSQIVFGAFTSVMDPYPLEFLCIPFLVWAAVRFRPQEAATAVLILAGVATWGTLSGFGPFVRATRNESLLLLQAFHGVMSIMTLTLAAVVAERREIEEKVARLATTDPLTGLANYRRLIEVLEIEMRRSERTHKPVTLLLFDMDGLKQINDRDGHLVGSRALCRLADLLQTHCRTIDIAARYGGDEFALVLPETDAESAVAVVHRIQSSLASDKEAPSLTVSVGAAEFRGNGQTFQDLFREADAALYEMKKQHFGIAFVQARRSGAILANGQTV